MSFREPTQSFCGSGVALSSLRRWWFLAPALILGAFPAVMAMKGDVSYTATGNLWIEPATPAAPGGAAPGTSEAGARNAWIELLRSYRVLEPVVMEHKLFVRNAVEHAEAFTSFNLREQFAPGVYRLRVGTAGEDFALVTEEGAPVQQGVVGEAIGANVGFDWTPARGSLPPGETIEFSVSSVRDAALDLSSRLVTVMDRSGSFLGLSLTGPDPERVAGIVNSLMERHVEIAADLKRAKLDETAVVLEEQLGITELELARAERDLERFRIARRDAEPREVAAETTEEERLRRRVRTTEALYTEVRLRVEEARLASASAMPDVRILDRATLTQRSHDAPRALLAALILFGFVGAALAGALLLAHHGEHSGPAGGAATTRAFGEDVVPVLAIIGGVVFAILAARFLLGL